MRSFVPVDHLRIICNGSIAGDLQMNPQTHDSADVSGTIPISRSGWCVLQALSDRPEFPVLDSYPYATTSPIYIHVAGSKPHSKADADYFVAWIDRLSAAAQKNADWNNEAEKQSVLDLLSRARTVYQQLAQ
jgi:hypothetical protein